MEDGTDKPPRIDFRAGDGEGGTQTDAPDEGGDPTAVMFKVLESKHPEYDALYWRKCKALYAGGRELFRDSDLLEHIFPQHRNEPKDIYQERLRRAFYITYPGEIIDYIVSGLMTDPIEMMAETEHDDYYDDLFEDMSQPGGRRCTLNQFLRAQILTALQCRVAWTQVDFPRVEEDAEPESEADQEEGGALDAYAFHLENEQVFDWEENGAGELTWVKCCVEENERPSFATGFGMVTRVYMIYGPTGWARYVVTFPRDKPPKPETMIPLDDVGEHSFGKVPILRLELPSGLWAMSKLEGMATELFNKRCALSWAEYKSLFQERHEFQAPPDPLASGPTIAEDQGRATDQVHGIGWTQVRYSGDRVEFIGPDSAPFGHAMASCRDIRDEMHRVTYQMALATDVGSAALQQSGDSKKENRAAHGVVLVGLGEYVRDHAFDLIQTISDGRQDDYEWTASGMSKFDTADVGSEIEDAEKLEGIDIPSPTFQLRYKYALAKAKLGDEASEEDLEKIESELEENLTPEQLGLGGPEDETELTPEEVEAARAMLEGAQDVEAGEPDQALPGYRSPNMPPPPASNGA